MPSQKTAARAHLGWERQLTGLRPAAAQAAVRPGKPNASTGPSEPTDIGPVVLSVRPAKSRKAAVRS